MKKLSLIIFFILYIGCAHSGKVLTADELAYGDVQVRSMLTDRKEMSYYRDKFGTIHELGPNDEIWKWAASKFAGGDFDKPINWLSDVPAPTEKCFLADHSYLKGFIRLASKYSCGSAVDSSLPFDLFWRLATFELLNIEGASEFKKIQSNTLECKLNREEYIRKNLKIEYNALLKQISFYKKIWLPWAKEKLVLTDSSYWREDILPFDDWLEWLKNSSETSGWSHWAYFYDVELRPLLKKSCY